MSSQLPSILEAVPLSATWGRDMPLWQGPTYHTKSLQTVLKYEEVRFFVKYKGDESSSNRKIENKDTRTLRPTLAITYLNCRSILLVLDHGLGIRDKTSKIYERFVFLKFCNCWRWCCWSWLCNTTTRAIRLKTDTLPFSQRRRKQPSKLSLCSSALWDILPCRVSNPSRSTRSQSFTLALIIAYGESIRFTVRSRLSHR